MDHWAGPRYQAYVSFSTLMTGAEKWQRMPEGAIGAGSNREYAFSGRDAWPKMMEINKESEEAVHVQLREQIIFRISTREYPAGYVMPSVRSLARLHGISPNTVSVAYKELVEKKWLIQRRGSRHIVLDRTEDKSGPEDLEALINRTIQVAQESGYSLQQLAARLRERLLEQPPDHLLIVEPETEMGELMREEIRQATGTAPAGCFVHSLPANPALAIGAVLLTPWYL
jgi:DNA-binding transcriptional regulator YhcF (GntR family)